jgi:hypothetical protein
MSGCAETSEEIPMEWILVVQLMRSGPVEFLEVHDCREGVVWMHQALLWAKRSGVDIGQPKYACYAADSPALLLVQR